MPLQEFIVEVSARQLIHASVNTLANDREEAEQLALERVKTDASWEWREDIGEPLSDFTIVTSAPKINSFDHAIKVSGWDEESQLIILRGYLDQLRGEHSEEAFLNYLQQIVLEESAPIPGVD